MTEVEEFFFRSSNNAAPFLGRFSFDNGAVSIQLVSFPGRASILDVIFKNAVVETLWLDEEDSIDWPLDIIGLDCYQAGPQHRFVLNCSSVEWIWRSDWPTISSCRRSTPRTRRRSGDGDPGDGDPGQTEIRDGTDGDPGQTEIRDRHHDSLFQAKLMSAEKASHKS